MHRVFYAIAALRVCLQVDLAFAGATPLTTVQIATGVGAIDMQIAPDDRTNLYVAARAGRIRLLNPATGLIAPTPFLDITALVNTSEIEFGFLGFCFDPDYASNGYVYVHYSDRPSGNCVIARFQRSATDPLQLDPATHTVILYLVQPNVNHRGGQLAFGPDGYLYISFGDGGGQGDPSNRAQNLTLLQGKMLRVDPYVDEFPADPMTNYGIPPTNPFVGHPTARPEIWAFGLRNPWRFSFDRQTGDLWIGDVGQGDREEIDFEPAGSPGGRNYGWKCMEGTLCRNIGGCLACDDPSYTPPIHEYNHQIGASITGGYVYRGCAMPEMHGVYFYAEWQRNKIFSLRYENGVVTEAQERTVELDPPGPAVITGVAAIGQDWDGELYFCSTLGGPVFKLVPNGVPAVSCISPGDLNCDGALTVSDIGPFVLALTDPAGYAAQFPSCDVSAADLNTDGAVTVSDIGPFVALLTS